MASTPTSKLLISRLKAKASSYHDQIPWIRKLPGPAVAVVSLLLITQLLVWLAAGIVLHLHPFLTSNAVLAYTLGLRHALDADHISAIDLVTRRLVAAGQRPATVGTWFSLGHSTIVIATSVVVAASSAAIRRHFDGISTVGGIIGSSVSAAFLLLLGAVNVAILVQLLRALRRATTTPAGSRSSRAEVFPFDPAVDDTGLQSRPAGCVTGLLRRLFVLVDRPWKMYPIGVLFGLGFDTSSEVALLGLSALQSARGTQLWLILIFPVLFTAGMCLLDTLDGAAMMSLYASARLAHDEIQVLYYQSVLTALTVVVAAVVGVLQVLSLILNVDPELQGGFWDGVAIAGDNYDIIGGAVCGSFVVFGALAVVCYGPWRRRVERRRMLLVREEDADDMSEPIGVLQGGSGRAELLIEGISGDDIENRENNGAKKSPPKVRTAELSVRPMSSSLRG